MNVHNSLKHYYTINQAIVNQQPGENQEKLQERSEKIEQDILKLFGLPNSFKFNVMLYDFARNEVLSDELIEETINTLRESAEQFLLKPVVSDIQLLSNAQRDELDAFDVIAELGAPSHDYTIFLISEMLLERGETPADVLEELHKVMQFNCLDDLFILSQSMDYEKNRLYPKIQSYNLKYADEYLKDRSSDAISDLDDEIAQLEGYEPELFTIANIVIEEIVFDVEVPPSIFAKIPAEGKKMKDVTIGLQFSELNQILLTCGEKGAQLSDVITKKLNIEVLEDPAVIDITEILGENLLADNCFLEVYQTQHLNDEGEWEKDEDNLLMVNKVFSRQEFEQNVLENELKNQLYECFQLIESAFTYYQRLLATGSTDKEARKQAGLQDKLLFKMALLLNKINGHSDIEPKE
jgi:hypothetical protein